MVKRKGVYVHEAHASSGFQRTKKESKSLNVPKNDLFIRLVFGVFASS